MAALWSKRGSAPEASHDLRLDPDVVAAVFSADAQVFVAEPLVAEGLSPDAFGLAVAGFDTTGRLTAPDGDAASADTVTVSAVPHDVVALVAHEDDRQGLDALMRAFETHDARALPEAILLSGASAGWSAQLAAKLVPALGRRLRALRAAAGTREAEIARLRRETEWRALQLRVGREMVEAIGFSTRTLAFEALPGDGTIGPEAVIPEGSSTGRSTHLAADAIAQRLPVDAAGLTGVSLHVAPDAGGRQAEGHLAICVADPVGTPLARSEIAFADLAPGWNDLAFDAAIGPRHGDAVLHVTTFAAQPRGAPRLSLAAQAVSRFGLVHPPAEGSLALRAWKGLSPQAFAAHDAPRRFERRSLDVAAATPLAGAAAAAIVRQRHGVSPLAVEGDTVRLIATTGSSGARFDDVLSEGTTLASARLAASESNAALLHAALAALPSSKITDPSALETAFAEAARTGALRTLGPGEEGQLLLRPSEPFAETRTLCAVLRPANAGETDGALLAATLRDLTVETAVPAEPDAAAPFARRVTFPEVKSRASYLWGAGEGLRANEAGGMPVVEVSDLESYMQTHPLPDMLTGARLTGVLPLGLTRVSAEVVTAHSQGPVGEYGLFVVPIDMGIANPDLFRRDMEEAARNGWRDLPDGILAWRTWSVPPGRPTRLTLDVPRLGEPADLFCTIRSLSGHTSYAWCRWTALDVTVSPEPARAHPTETMPRP